jgi:hypothetical protein
MKLLNQIHMCRYVLDLKPNSWKYDHSQTISHDHCSALRTLVYVRFDISLNSFRCLISSHRIRVELIVPKKPLLGLPLYDVKVLFLLFF